MTIHSEIPIGSGLGSSASFSVGLAAALLCLNHSVQLPLKTKDLELISSMAFEAEKLIHGTPSGIDNTICTYGKFQ
jgi:mevalonate kinase